MTAAEYGYVNIVTTLIENGAVVNTQNNAGLTPAMFAVRWRQTEVIQVLLRHGADPTLKNKLGQTMRDLATDAETAALVDQEVRSQRQIRLRAFMMGTLRRLHSNVVRMLPIDVVGMIAALVVCDT
eukprot:c21143_g1_i1.p1 GENE.c21143_g1_i1~~c21143_g1_i1.p1  ORF type:complete len:126 (+),score=28.44 c21143_g1_i1:361-738(+)